MDIASRIRECRTGSGLTQRAVAEAVGVRTGTANAWEGTTVPDLSSVIKLADLFGVSLHWLVTGQGPKRLRRTG